MFECKLKIQGESREDVGERIKKKISKLLQDILN